jgi:GTPase SAR1 family protein
LGRISYNICYSYDLTFIIKDTAGQERFGSMARVYYKEAHGCIIVFDVTRASTFDAVSKWKADLDNKVQFPDGNPIPCILLANKVLRTTNIYNLV